MNKDEIKWFALEYREVHRSNDWYWAVGITAFALAVGSILIKNFLFAIFIILSVSMVFYFSKRKPKEIEVAINRKGIRMNEYIYPFDSIKHFCIDHSDDEPRLLFMSSRLVDPIVSVYIEEDDVDDIANYLKTKIKEKAIQEPKHRLVMERLGF